MVAALEPTMTAASPLPGGAATDRRASAGRSVAGGALALLGTQPVTWSATLLTAILLPRFLGADGMGRYGAAFSIAMLATSVASLGVPDALKRRIAQQPWRTPVDGPAALLLLTGFSLVLSVVLGAALWGIGQPLARGWLLPIALLWMVASVGQATLLALLVGQERHARMAWLNAGGVVIAAGLGLGVVALGGGAEGYMAALLAAAILVVALGWRSARFDAAWHHALDRAVWRDLGVAGLPFLGWNVALAARGQMDVVLSAILLRPEVAGWLTAAQRIIAIPVFIPTLVATPLLPALSRSAGDRPTFERTLRRSLIVVLAITLPICALTAALAPAIPDFLGWGAGFAGAVPLIVVLALQQPLIAANMILGTGLFARQDERRWLKVAAGATLFKLAMNAWAIPAFQASVGNGALGAAVFEVVTESAMVVGAVRLLPAGTLDRTTGWLCARVTMAATLILPTANGLLGVAGLPLAAALALAVYVLAALALRVVRRSDLVEAVGMVRAMARRGA